MVDGILAFCYASVDHDLAHIGTIHLRWFPQIIELICGVEDGNLGYINIMKHLGHILLTHELGYSKSSYEENLKKTGEA